MWIWQIMTRYDFLWARCSNRFELSVNFSCEWRQIITRSTSYGLDEWAIFEPTWTWPNFPFGQLCMWIGANNDLIWLPMGWMSDSEKCSNRLELYLISLLVNFSCELGQIMTRYDLLWTGSVILSNVRTDLTLLNFTFGQLFTLFMWIGVNNDQIWLPMG